MTAVQNIVIERTYRATVQEIWDLWTTKDGFESWWGPEGFRVEVHELDARVGGALRYDMIASSPEAIEGMKRIGQPPVVKTHGKFSELKPRERLALTHVIDFFPGVTPYENTMVVELFPTGNSVRMAVTLSPMHDASFSQMQRDGLTSQLTKLDRRFAR
ncbi:MAG: activator of Hsp90 ATPase 1 family protein [Chloroflexi bacterium 13_1_20CM_4_66_7]|nr:MAG: activator of Hsp90 ATPase 1 family protein [Chloroflexi bacterium 13_1_20CM_4_66_7]TMA16728.1 MAG: SRPBCC domain-containing protein [Deltaproteobacteria bacterium]TMB29294.1 MAG: SRPBCC domain-containing protein [Deltaproteobacteria bacterium]TMB31032.1 MAG: SRPBCC domain-containing protein [Deltaproteobacteria bacterium]